MHRAAGSAVVAGAPRQGSRSQTLDGLPVQAVEPEGPFLPHSDQAALFQDARVVRQGRPGEAQAAGELATAHLVPLGQKADKDRKSTRLNSSHVKISYAVFCLKKKTINCTSATSSTTACT